MRCCVFSPNPTSVKSHLRLKRTRVKVNLAILLFDLPIHTEAKAYKRKIDHNQIGLRWSRYYRIFKEIIHVHMNIVKGFIGRYRTKDNEYS